MPAGPRVLTLTSVFITSGIAVPLNAVLNATAWGAVTSIPVPPSKTAETTTSRNQQARFQIGTGT
ncbi:MAG: hypothetical protein WC708_04670 [Lentisphaeria bacterium]